MLAGAAACGSSHAAIVTNKSVVVNAALKHQVIEGFGGCISHWQTGMQELFNDNAAFQNMLINDLGVTIVRGAMPPAVQATEDLDTNTLDLSAFDMTTIGWGRAAQALRLLNPELKVISSMWSPPAWMKTNADTINGGHLRTDRRPHFAKYCAGVCLAFSNYWGVPLYALSPQNEAYFTEPYDSCVYTYSEYYEMMKYLAAAFKRWNVTSRVYGPEDMGLAENRVMSYLSSIVNDTNTSPYFQICATHGYGNDGISAAGAVPAEAEPLRNWLAPYHKESWMTETSGEYPAWTNGYYIDSSTFDYGALSLAWRIHVGLVHGDQAAFVYWTLSDPGPSKYGLLGYNVPTCKYYAAKQFYRWIRPNAQRIDATTWTNDLGVGAFLHVTNQTLTLTFINVVTADMQVRVTLTNMPWAVPAFETYRSSLRENCAKLANTVVDNDGFALSVPAQSIVTLYSGVPTNAIPVTTASALDFSTNRAALTIPVGNGGLAPFTYAAAVTTGAAWLTVAPQNGTISNQIAALVASADREALPPGPSTGAVLITTSAGTSFVVNVVINQMPDNAVPTVTPGQVGFDTMHTTLFLYLGNYGRAPYTFSAAVLSGGAWLDVLPRAGTVSNPPYTLYVTGNRLSVPPGVYTGAVQVATSAGTTVVVTCSITILAREPYPLITPLAIVFSTNGTVAPITLTNAGLDAFSFSACVTTGADWLSVMPTNGIVSNQAALVLATADWQALAQGTNVGAISITPTSGNGVCIAAQAVSDVPEPLSAAFLLLSFLWRAWRVSRFGADTT